MHVFFKKKSYLSINRKLPFIPSKPASTHSSPLITLFLLLWSKRYEIILQSGAKASPGWPGAVSPPGFAGSALQTEGQVPTAQQWGLQEDVL